VATPRYAIRNDTAANWASANPTLGDGEWGYESDTGNAKIGNGATAWNSLAYFGAQPGDIKSFGGASAPFGWLSADGDAVSRTTYASLFAVIGTTWGAGDGSTTFNLPDLRGAYLRGAGSHGTETMADGNAYSGPAVGAFEDDQMQGHEHQYSINVGDAGGVPGFSPATSAAATPGSSRMDVTTPISDGTNGTPRTGDETRAFAAGVLWCIKI
jgi:microcystin-dependent protein